MPVGRPLSFPPQAWPWAVAVAEGAGRAPTRTHHTAMAASASASASGGTSLLFTNEQLSKGTASRLDGISEEDEESYRLKTNEFVFALIRKLDMCVRVHPSTYARDET